jgi:hypothetical protein
VLAYAAIDEHTRCPPKPKGRPTPSNNGIQITTNRDSANDLVPVTTWVPAPHVMEFQIGVAALLIPLGSGGSPADRRDEWPIALAEAVAELRNAWDNARWTDDDGDRAAWVKARIDPPSPSGSVLRALITSPDGVNGQDLANAAGIKTGSVPSCLGALSSHTRRVRRRPMWEADRVGGVWRYRMEPPSRRLFSDFGGGA